MMEYATFNEYKKEVWDKLSDNQKLLITIWFNSEFDAYGINGTGEYEPLDIEGMADYAYLNNWEFDYETGRRINY